MFELEMLPAECGDSLILRWGPDTKPFHLIIDGGLGKAESLRLHLKSNAAARTPELLVVTHIDNDHILGVRELFERSGDLISPKRIWFNARSQMKAFFKRRNRLGAPDGDRLMQLLEKPRWKAVWEQDPLYVSAGKALPTWTLGTKTHPLKLTLLSPDEPRLEKLADEWLAKTVTKLLEPDRLGSKAKRARLDAFTIAELANVPFKADRSVPNGSSLAFIAEYDGKRVLCGADAYAPVLESSLVQYKKDNKLTGRLKLSAFKLPHHGSEANVSTELLALIDCKHFLISTDGSQFEHPDDVAVARVLKSTAKPTLWLNYLSARNQQWGAAALQGQVAFKVKYPKSNDGICVPL